MSFIKKAKDIYLNFLSNEEPYICQIQEGEVCLFSKRKQVMVRPHIIDKQDTVIALLKSATNRAELLEVWLALTSFKYHDNLLA